jgi:hypothetical protein
VSSGLDAVAELITGLGAYARPQRVMLARLAANGDTLAELIKETALPRRVVEELLQRLGDDLATDGARLSVTTGARAAYRERFGLDQLRPDDRHPSDPLVATMREIIAAAPRPNHSLDHVPATAETVIERARWLDRTFDLAGATLLFVGDHDLTSVGVSLVNPAARAAVVDLDEALLGFLEQRAEHAGWPIQTWWADLRFGLPPALRDSADLAFTDPPYTPDGVRLFLVRSLEGLRDRRLGRVLLAYGSGSHQPAVGLAVQREIGALSLVCEAILPHFNRYNGAQAVGSAADLYQLRPTGGSWPAIDRTHGTRRTESAGRSESAGRGPIAIYTHGERSVESGATRDPALAATLLDAAAGPDRLPVAAVVTPDRPRPERDEVALADLLAGPGAIRNGRSAAVAVDATADPGPWLARILLAAAGPRLAVAVTNNHPDTTSQAAQQSLAGLVAAKWTLRFRRSTPDPGHAIIEAVRVDPAALSPADTVRRAILDGAHRSLENSWRDGLVKACRRAGEPPLTKDAAQLLIAAAGLPDELLASRPIDLARHRLTHTLANLEPPGSTGSTT